VIEGPLRFHVRPALRDAALLIALEGWNDAGEAATTAVRFVANELGAAPLAEIDAEAYFDFTVRRPFSVVEDGVARGLEWPATRFRYAAARPHGRVAGRDLVTCSGVEPHLRWRDWSDHVLRLVDAVGIQRVLLLGAFLGDVLYSRPVDVTGVASDAALLRELAVEPVRYAGPVGMIGVLGQRLRATSTSSRCGRPLANAKSGARRWWSAIRSCRSTSANSSAASSRNDATSRTAPSRKGPGSFVNFSRREKLTNEPGPFLDGAGAGGPGQSSIDSSISMTGIPSSTG
jgi:hypothetical protein